MMSREQAKSELDDIRKMIEQQEDIAAAHARLGKPVLAGRARRVLYQLQSEEALRKDRLMTAIAEEPVGSA